MSKYLLEVGTEELPYKFIPSAIEQLNKGFTTFLNDNKVKFSDVKVYATPRRLAVIVDGLENKTEDEEKIVKGPIAKVAFDEAGNLTKAGEGFARKNNLSKEDLYIENNYVHAKIVIKGKPIAELLQENVPSIFMKLQGSHFMRWGYNDEKFSRPIKWIVSILDENEVKIKIIDKESSNHSRGHRFSTQDILIKHPDNYVEEIKKAHVIVDQAERKQIIVEKAKEEAAKLGAVPYYTDDLLEEVTFITEYPVPAVCEFDPVYLDIPEEVTVTVMAVHQRYFALHKEGKLINKFITMTNYIGDEFKNIKAGNVRVIKARLDDAVFFFKEDTKKPLVDYVEALKGVTFQKGMGTMFDKTQRLIKLSNAIAGDLNVPTKDVERTALLCKADLTTNLVFEFTELQGFIGADYARVSKEDDKVVQGIKEHYFPLNAESETAKGIEGQIVGIADKIDTVCAVFAAGKKPTGSSDPLGVRRAALGVIKTILDGELKIDVDKYIKEALKLLPIQRDCANEVNEFFVQRMIIFLADKYNKNVLEACSKKNPLKDIADYVQRVQVVSEMNSPQLNENANRVIRILKDSTGENVNEKYFVEPIEKILYNAINNIDENVNYNKYLEELESLNSTVSKFFEDVLVMDKDENVKNNRIALLSLLKGKYEHLTDFSKI
ncbi:MAG TPA: glycine--tRNA ligase subunit beta [Cyanobacteria bacterium UBA10660]|nr:MAG TPA: glycine--tRNA ligase subunit beta [Candidatus Gastranaerophilales bacterium HUM_1]HAS93703.1 glycine--tRNA ligase subunit beta [Cyanobacteria bacterium UBA10660]